MLIALTNFIDPFKTIKINVITVVNTNYQFLAV